MYQYILASLLIAGQLTGCSAPDQTEALISRIPDEPIPYTSYAGPILPLEVQTEGLAADRSVSLDLSAGDGTALVTDRYVLSNPDSAARTVQLCYPFITPVQSLATYTPEARMDGSALPSEVLVGGWNSWGGIEPTGFDTLADYIESGAALADAQAEAEIGSREVTLYTFSGLALPENGEAAFVIPATDRPYAVFSSGMGSRYGDGMQTYILDRPEQAESALLLVLEPLPADAGLRFYDSSGAPATGACQVETQSMPLEQALETCVAAYLAREPEEDAAACTDAQFARALVTALPDTLLRDPSQLYGEGSLRSVFDAVAWHQRVNYLQSEVTIPANGSIEVEYTMRKAGSFNQSGSYPGLCGYEIVTSTGNALDFRRITATTVAAEGCASKWQTPVPDPLEDAAVLSADVPLYTLGAAFS